MAITPSAASRRTDQDRNERSLQRRRTWRACASAQEWEDARRPIRAGTIVEGQRDGVFRRLARSNDRGRGVQSPITAKINLLRHRRGNCGSGSNGWRRRRGGRNGRGGRRAGKLGASESPIERPLNPLTAARALPPPARMRIKESVSRRRGCARNLERRVGIGSDGCGQWGASVDEVSSSGRSVSAPCEISSGR